MKNIYLSLIAISILIVSCKKDEKATYLKEEAGVQQPAVNNDPKASLLDQAGIKTTQNTPAIAQAAVTGANPPHGQPGHRCDIPVGQPLNSQPTASNTQITQNPNGTQTIQIDPNALKPGKFTADNNGKPVKTALGMNPPHGEPGHRCDIPVGQPLNSKGKPAPPSQPVQTIAQNTPTPALTPAPTGEKPKLNPAHGEPWHNCAVKVGEPLP